MFAEELLARLERLLRAGRQHHLGAICNCSWYKVREDMKVVVLYKVMKRKRAGSLVSNRWIRLSPRMTSSGKGALLDSHPILAWQFPVIEAHKGRGKKRGRQEGVVARQIE